MEGKRGKSASMCRASKLRFKVNLADAASPSETCFWWNDPQHVHHSWKLKGFLKVFLSISYHNFGFSVWMFLKYTKGLCVGWNPISQYQWHRQLWLTLIGSNICVLHIKLNYRHSGNSFLLIRLFRALCGLSVHSCRLRDCENRWLPNNAQSVWNMDLNLTTVIVCTSDMLSSSIWT